MYRFIVLFFFIVPFLFSACKITPDNETTTASDDNTTVGPDGGRVFAPNSGAYIIIQPDTFQVETNISLNDVVSDVPLEVQASGVVEITPVGATFSKPVTLVIPYSGGGFDPQDLQIFWSSDPNAPIESWQAIDSMVDPAQNIVSAHIGQFGYFVVGIADSSVTGTDDTADTSSSTGTATATDTATETTTDTSSDTAIGTGTDVIDTSSDTVTDTVGTSTDSTTDTTSGASLDYCATSPCGEHGTCTNLDSSYSCACDVGYAGSHCDYCDANYQDNNGDGICVANCTISGSNCGTHGACDDSSGAPVCVCASGYAGASCADCAPGYQDNDSNGTCSSDCATSGLTCAANSACDDSSGTAICLCTTGYAGATCSACASGYQDNDNNGSCMPNCASAGLVCGANGTCDDSAGTAVCDCDAAYSGATCNECAPGYQDNDNNNVCLPTCAQLGWTCSGNGACSDVSGEAMCNCDVGYSSDGAGGCFVSGHTCLESIELTVGTYPVSGTVTGTTVGAGANYDPSASCASASSSDVVYSFTLTEISEVTFSTAGSNFDTVLYLRSDCDDPADEIVCNDDGDSGTQSYIETVLEPGTYAVFVDGYSTYTGDFILSYTIDSVDPCNPNPCTTAGQTTCVGNYPSYTCACDTGWISDGAGGCVLDTGEGHTCDMAIVLPATSLPVSGSVTGTTTGAGFDYDASCGNDALSEEMIYTFTVAEPVLASFSTEGSSYDSVLHMRTDCDDSTSEIACSDDIASDIYQSSLELILDPGTYSVFVDGYYNSMYGQSGDYTLSYSLTPNPCSANPCGANSTGCTPSSDWLSFTCQCEVGYFQDPLTGVCIPGTAEGQTCDTAVVLPATSLPVSGSVTGTTVGTGADYVGSCGSSVAEEVVYSFTVAEQVVASFSTEGSAYDTVLYMRSACDTEGTEIACNDDISASVAGPSSLEDLLLSPGTYFVFVDGYNVNSGDYTLSYELTPTTDPCAPNPCTITGQTTCTVVSPASYVCECDFGWISDGAGGCIPEVSEGDTCAQPFVLSTSTLPASGFVTGTTTGAGDDHISGACFDGAEEVVYSFTVTDSVFAVFSLAGSSYDTVMYLRSDCENAASELACNDQYNGTNQSHLEAQLAAGTYFLFIDGYQSGGDTGDYVLDYSLTPVATGEDCSSPIMMPAIVPTSQVVTGTSTGLGNLYQGDCGGSTSEEAVHSFTVAETVFATFSTGGSAFDTVLYVRSGCASGTEMGCNDDGDGLGFQSYLEMTLSPGTYSVFVDGYGAESGDYVLSYTLDTP